MQTIVGCEHVLDFSDFKVERYVREYKCNVGIAKCPKCGLLRRLMMRWRNHTPPGGIVCGGSTGVRETEEL
jgi:hypothetical protein